MRILNEFCTRNITAFPPQEYEQFENMFASYIKLVFSRSCKNVFLSCCEEVKRVHARRKQTRGKDKKLQASLKSFSLIDETESFK